MPICKSCRPRFGRNARAQYGTPAPLLSVPGADKAGVLYWDTGSTASDIANSIAGAGNGSGPTMNAGWRGPIVQAPASAAPSPLRAAITRYTGWISPTGAPASLPSKDPVALVGENRPVFSKGAECVSSAVTPMLPVISSDVKRFLGLSLVGLIVGSVLRDANGGNRL